MWCPNDKKAFECSEWHNVGQINSELPVGQTLINIVKVLKRKISDLIIESYPIK